MPQMWLPNDYKVYVCSIPSDEDFFELCERVSVVIMMKVYSNTNWNHSQCDNIFDDLSCFKMHKRWCNKVQNS